MIHSNARPPGLLTWVGAAAIEAGLEAAVAVERVAAAEAPAAVVEVAELADAARRIS